MLCPGSKNGSQSSAVASTSSVRFHKADGEVVEVTNYDGSPLSLDHGGRAGASTSEPISTPGSHSPTSGIDASSSILDGEGTPPSSEGLMNNFLDASSNVSFNLKEPSPIKEAILSKFAKLAPAGTHSPTSLISEREIIQARLGSSVPESGPSSGSASWLNQVRGRIAKTVEERYGGYAKDKRLPSTSTPVKLAQTGTSQSLDLSDQEDNGGTPISGTPSKMTKTISVSQEDCHTLSSEAAAVGALSHSLSDQHFRASEAAFMSLPPDLTLSSAPLEAEPDPHPVEADGLDEADSKTPVVMDPVVPRRKFTFPSFMEKRDRSVTTPKPEEVAKPTTEAVATPIPVCEATPTRTSTLRLRMMGLMGKANNNNNPKDCPVFLRDLTNPNIEDPFSGLSELPSPETEHDISIASSLGQSPNAERDGSEDTDQVETALEADEMMVFDPAQESLDDSLEGMDEADAEDSPQPPDTVSLFTEYWWVALLPICVILLLQFLPFPSWVTGFITGVLISVPTASFLMWTHFIEPQLPPRTKFITNVKRRIPKQQAIIVQEELERKYTWMNLWPPKNGAYDPLTYDVRRTMSVRIMLHGPWIELKFPKRNLPLRRMCDDKEPANMVFLDQKEVIDLTNCTIDLIPENLPGKRIWSKKYPIRIRTNQRKPPNDQDTSQEIEKPDSTQNDPALFQPDEFPQGYDEPDEAEKEEMMFDAVGEVDGYDEIECREDLVNDEPDVPSSFVMVQNEKFKTFYLFTRTSREKEEWFNRFMVGAKFMQDWNHQNPPKERTVNPDPHYLTFKAKEQRFKVFMENYFQARHMEGAERVHNLTKEDAEKQQVAKEQVAVLNIFGGRLWYDLHNSQGFIDLLREKITRKLLKVKIAQYFKDVSVTTLDLGQRLPRIMSASLPWQDENGLWVNFDIEYTGICQATVETNGIRLPGKDEPDREAAELLTSRPAATMDSDEEDSAEDDDDLPDLPENSEISEICTVGSPSDHQQVHGATFKTRMLENLLKSDFVAKMATSEWVKKNITERNITLQLQLHSLKGTLTLNLPPAPSDRVWYGFRTPPQLEIALRPCFGGKGLGKYENTFSSVMRQLENRLKQEFMKVLVHPNLDDEVLPFLDHVEYSLLNT
eukprot:snap_masked-scaffold70_size417918-processed-gene-2.2 protein:Tk01879 transcript:snap_masked-scaffold70_size417918-processed-gene-2.2-mRNA-1 annotation:"testis-expressed sequence 2 protein isoform x1"